METISGSRVVANEERRMIAQGPIFSGLDMLAGVVVAIMILGPLLAGVIRVG